MLAEREVLERLEWPRVREILAEGTRTPMGRARALSLVPGEGDPDVAAARVEQLRRYHQEKGRLPVTAVEDPAGVLVELGVAGRVLTGEQIYETVRLLSVARDVAGELRRLDPEDWPDIGSFWARFPVLDGVIDGIEGNLAPSGHVEDHASPELARIRGEIRHLSETLERTLQKILRASWTGPVLRDRYVTIRNERYVVPVRTDSPRRFHGIVHGHSASEKTIFVEPIETVEINNRLVALRDEEQREIERILAGYTEMLRAVRDEIETTARVLGEIDLLEAIAEWAEAEGAVRADLVAGGTWRLVRVRHPVLERTLRGARPPRAMVPLDLDIGPETRVLVISGPNAGGKTVALKTLGLAVLLAHAGIPVPAEEARLPRVSRVFADIGDEQSITSSLSTFSSHVRNLAEMVREAREGVLSLVDEIGTGTDPAEGAALGVAVLETLRERGSLVVATTHHTAVKSWAYRAEGVTNAACEFDEATMRPTYRLVQGVAGASVGLTMAEQLGLDPVVVDRARALMDPAGKEAARALDSVRALAATLERERAEVQALRRKLEEELAAAREKARRAEERRRREWQERVETLLREFRAEAQRMISRVEDARVRKAMERERARREKELKERFAGEERTATAAAPPPPGWTPRPGERVLSVRLGKEGVVRGLRGKGADVLFGRTLFTVPLEDLRPLGKPGEAARPEEDRPGVRRARVPAGVTADLPEKEVPRELVLIGKRVDEALALLDKYLDDACLAGLAEVRVVHGFGTGRLKKAVREFLADHPEVHGFRDGGKGEGGGGATVVRLAPGEGE